MTIRLRARTLAMALLAGAACLLTGQASGYSAAPTAALVPLAALGTVQAIGATDGAPPVYVATTAGLFRSANPTYTLWSQQSAITTISALSPNPRLPDDLLFTAISVFPQTGPPPETTYRSTDGGRTARPLSWPCPLRNLTRAPSDPRIVYGIVDAATPCATQASTQSTGPAEWVARSSDDGLTWTTVYSKSVGYEYPGSLGPITVDPLNPQHLLMTYIEGRLTGDLLGSSDGGRTWTTLQPWPLEYNFPISIAINPRAPREVWTAWGALGAYHSRDGGRTWRQVLPGAYGTHSYSDAFHTAVELSGAAVLSVAVDSLTGRTYLGLTQDAYPPTAIYALDAQGHLDHFAPLDANPGAYLALMNAGYLFSWCDSDAYCRDATPPAVHPLSGAGSWDVSAMLRAAVPGTTLLLLGSPLSPTESCNSAPCQYFDKGALAVTPHGALTVVPLVPALLNTRSTLPVGGSPSTVTYRTLFALHGKRTPLHAGFKGGTRAVPGGTFVPYSPTLAPTSGYVVPAVFWRYLNDPRTAPGGWQQAIGLPLAPAVPVMVTKGKLGRRSILVQAFQRAILTYDSRNAAPFQVERANIGADYAALFPVTVR